MILSKNLLYSADKQSGRYYEEVVKERPELKQEAKEDPFDELFVNWYLKTGLFCKMDFVTFMNQPYWAMKEITKQIDKRLENPGEQVLNYEHLALLLALAKLFGG